MENNKNKRVVIIRGASGSGKSTFIKNNLPGAFVCSADDYFVSVLGGGKTYAFNPRRLGDAHNWCFDAFKQAITADEPLIVIDNTNIKKAWYEHYVKYAKEHGYEVFQKCLTGSFKNTHGVSDTAIQKMKSGFEVDAGLPELT